MSEISQTVRDSLIYAIANDLEHAISELGYPVGLGLAPDPDSCTLAATTIIDRISPRALELLAELERTK